MAQQIKASTAKPKDVSSVTETYMVGRERGLTPDMWAVVMHTHVCVRIHMCVCTHTHA